MGALWSAREATARHKQCCPHRAPSPTRPARSCPLCCARYAPEGLCGRTTSLLGGGPVGTSTAWFLAEREKEVMLLHDPKDAGAHEDWSRLARLSFDGPADEMQCSQHAIELLDLIEEVRSMNTGAPVVPVKPGMLFVASP